MQLDLGNFTFATLDDFGDITFEFDDNDLAFEVVLKASELIDLLNDYQETKKNSEVELSEGVVVEVSNNTVEIKAEDEDGYENSLYFSVDDLLEQLTEFYE